MMTFMKRRRWNRTSFPGSGSRRGAARAILCLGLLAMLEACAGSGRHEGPSGASEPPRAPPGGAPESEKKSGAEEEVQRLRARAAELESTLGALKSGGSVAPAAAPAQAKPAPLPQVKDLLAMTGRAEGAALSREVEKLLLGGQEGFALLHDFFQQADVDHPKIDAITHHPQLIYSMLRVVALHPDEVARFSSYLMKATRDQPQSWLRREYFNFLPVFLLQHPGRYPDLRQDLEDDIVFQIQQGGAFLYKVSLAMRDLDFKPPAEIFLPILEDPEKRESHGLVIQELAARKDEGLRLLRRYIDETKDFKSPTMGAVLEAVAQLEGAGGGTVAKLLDHEDPSLRGAALFAYFGQPRDDTELPRAIEFLNSTMASPAQKRTFISLLAQRNTDLFDSLFAGAETSIADPQVKEALRRTAAAVARQKARKAEAAAKKARGDGGTPPPGQAPEGSTPP
jgi:hypothetical protein